MADMPKTIVPEIQQPIRLQPLEFFGQKSPHETVAPFERLLSVRDDKRKVEHAQTRNFFNKIARVEIAKFDVAACWLS
jgi:hypothetical protein